VSARNTVTRTPVLLVVLLFFCSPASAYWYIDFGDFLSTNQDFANVTAKDEPAPLTFTGCVWSYQIKRVNKNNRNHVFRDWILTRDSTVMTRIGGGGTLKLEMTFNNVGLAAGISSALVTPGHTGNFPGAKGDKNNPLVGTLCGSAVALEVKIDSDDWWSQPAGDYAGTVEFEICHVKNSGIGCRINSADNSATQSVSFTIAVPEAVKLTLDSSDDLHFGTLATAGTGAANTPSVGVCVYHRGDSQAQLMLNSANTTSASGTANTFNVARVGGASSPSATALVEYTVKVDAVPFITDQKQGVTADAGSPSCSGGSNHTVNVELVPGAVDAVEEGTYQDTLTFTVTPN